tara:strand:+ start:933 stop:1091 length:159 start_codon:yes stop_codon:yes gene_type:complete
MAVGKFPLQLFLVAWDISLTLAGGGSEEIMSELALREETKDLKKYAKASSKL